MLAAKSRRLTSAFAYGDTNPLESCVTIGKYTSAKTIADRIQVPKSVLALIAVWYQLARDGLFLRLTPQAHRLFATTNWGKFP
jgi:hypothetical protein